MAYEINININGDVTGGGTADGSAAANVGAPRKGGTTDISHLSKYIAAQTIQPFISKTKDFVVSNIELTTGSKAMQQKANFAMEGVQLGLGAFKNAQAGAVITSSLGMGGAIGTALGVSLTIFQIGFDLMQQRAQLELQRKEEDYQQNYLYQRSGMAYSQSRRGA